MQHLLDPCFLPFYRLTGLPGLDGIIGTFLLALAVVVVGEFTISLVFLANRRHLDNLNRRLQKYKQANDAYGHVFFNKFGLSAAALWPAFFALDWMQPHFAETGVPIPGYSSGVNYVVAFLVCYILARIVFGRLKRHLPYFRGQYRMLQSYGRDGSGPLN